jgi:Fe-S-cluster containining protein
MSRNGANPCLTCGACCVDQVILVSSGDHVPVLMRDGDFMRRQLGRCVALTGRVGIDPRCSIYADRPKICRVMRASVDHCDVIRGSYGLPPVRP